MENNRNSFENRPRPGQHFPENQAQSDPRPRPGGPGPTLQRPAGPRPDNHGPRQSVPRNQLANRGPNRPGPGSLAAGQGQFPPHNNKRPPLASQTGHAYPGNQGRQNPYGATSPRQRNFQQMETQPIEDYQSKILVGEGPTRRTKKTSKAVPVILSLVLLLAIASTLVLVLKPKGIAADELAYRENTNQYRTLAGNIQKEIVRQHEGLKRIGNAFVGTESVKLSSAGNGLEEPNPKGLPFVDNDVAYDYVEQQDIRTMGRLVIPSIGTNGPLADVANDQSLYYGFGIVDFMPDMSDQGMNVILGHRCLTQEAGMMYMEEMKEGDPFYIDDYRIGKRYIYHTKINENVTEEEYFQRFIPEGILPGQSSMLVTCDPMIYNVSDRRILVYGSLTEIIDIPESDEFYQRYLSEHGME